MKKQTLRESLMLRATWLVLAACAGTTPSPVTDLPRLQLQPIPCGQPLPADCESRRSSYSELPSRSLAATSRPPGASDDGQQDYVSPQLKLGSKSTDTVPEVTFVLERAALGWYGDTPEERQISERSLARLLVRFGDDGGAADLLDLLTHGPEGSSLAGEYRPLLHKLAGRCRTLKVFNAIGWAPDCESPPFDLLPHGRVMLAELCLFKARGLVEVGKYDEARALFREYAPKDDLPAEFVPQCVAWLEARTEKAEEDP
jgi:hypothetical protein